MKSRRSLTHVGGPTDTAGDPSMARLLAEALDVPPAPAPSPRAPDDAGPVDDPDRVHVHGFHTYPARMHPGTAAKLVQAVSEPGQTVLDPFCGSGTVLVEAMLAGRRARGTDLNPLAVRLARLKTSLPGATDRAAIVAEASVVAAFADDRRKRRAGATHRYPREDVEAFDPHVLLELDSLRAGIAQTAAGDAVHDALVLVLSAILVKLSRRSSDTSTAQAPRRLAAGFAARLFVRKTEELAARLAQATALAPAGAQPARVEVDDAARLRTVAASTVDAVVTSPPYVATYDYLDQHALRMRWLGLDAHAFATGEMGSRRRYDRLEAPAARDAWARELTAMLRAMSRVCRGGARVALLVADSAVDGVAIRGLASISAVAGEAGFAVQARASQARPHFHGPTVKAFRQAPRAEHAIVLRKEGGTGRART